MAYGKYVRRQPDIEAFQFMNTKEDLQGLKDFGVKEFQIAITSQGDGFCVKLTAFDKKKVLFTCIEGDYIIRSGEGPMYGYEAWQKERFELEFKPAGRMG